MTPAHDPKQGPLAHQGKYAIFDNCLHFIGPWRKWPGMAPNGARRIFFQLIQTLPTFWAERIWNLTVSTFFILWIQKFCISRSPDFPNLAWAGPGLDLRGGGEMLASQATAVLLGLPLSKQPRLNLLKTQHQAPPGILFVC